MGANMFSPSHFQYLILMLDTSLLVTVLQPYILSRTVYMLLYADDVAFLSASLVNLESMVEIAHNQFQDLDLASNFDKAKVVQAWKSPHSPRDFFVSSRKMKLVQSFNYF